MTKSAVPTSKWQQTMTELAARHNDACRSIAILEEMLSTGLKKPNQIRRAEEDAIRTYSLFISKLVESYEYE